MRRPIARASGNMKYIGCDRDPEALAIAAKNLAPWKDKVELIHGDFAKLDQHLEERRN